MAERSYRQVMEENERLSDKLSRLERVFVSSSTPSLGGPDSEHVRMG